MESLPWPYFSDVSLNNSTQQTYIEDTLNRTGTKVTQYMYDARLMAQRRSNSAGIRAVRCNPQDCGFESGSHT